MSGGCSLGIATSSRWAGHVSGLHMRKVLFIYTSKKQVETVADKVIPVFDKALYSSPFKVHFTAFFYLPVVEQLKHEDV